jgi:hypothetical protein
MTSSFGSRGRRSGLTRLGSIVVAAGSSAARVSEIYVSLVLLKRTVTSHTSRRANDYGVRSHTNRWAGRSRRELSEARDGRTLRSEVDAALATRRAHAADLPIVPPPLGADTVTIGSS